MEWMATGDSNGTSDRSTAARTPRVLGQEADTWTGNDGVVVALVLVLVVDRKISKNVLTEARVVFVAGDAMTIRFMEGRGVRLFGWMFGWLFLCCCSSALRLHVVVAQAAIVWGQFVGVGCQGKLHALFHGVLDLFFFDVWWWLLLLLL